MVELLPSSSMDVRITAQEREDGNKGTVVGHARPKSDMIDLPPAPKRQRQLHAEDQKRGQRLMGNLLGTLGKFKNEEKARASSSKARQRDEIANKVAQRLQTENARLFEITTLEREVKTCRMEIERKGNALRQKEKLTQTRSQELPRLSHLLKTTSTTQWSVRNSASTGLALAHSTANNKAAPPTLKTLYYLPKILLPEQEMLIRQQEEGVDRILLEEEEEVALLRTTVADALQDLERRLHDAIGKLSQVRDGGSINEDLKRKTDGNGATAPDDQMQMENTTAAVDEGVRSRDGRDGEKDMQVDE